MFLIRRVQTPPPLSSRPLARRPRQGNPRAWPLYFQNMFNWIFNTKKKSRVKGSLFLFRLLFPPAIFSFGHFFHRLFFPSTIFSINNFFLRPFFPPAFFPVIFSRYRGKRASVDLFSRDRFSWNLFSQEPFRPGLFPANFCPANLFSGDFSCGNSFSTGLFFGDLISGDHFRGFARYSRTLNYILSKLM